MTAAIAPSPSSSVSSAPSVLKDDPAAFSMDLRTARGVGELLLKDLANVIDDGLVAAMNENRVPAGKGFHSMSGYLERAEDDGRGRLVRIPTPTEESVFDALGIPYIEPAHRSESSLGMCRRES